MIDRVIKFLKDKKLLTTTFLKEELGKLDPFTLGRAGIFPFDTNFSRCGMKLPREGLVNATEQEFEVGLNSDLRDENVNLIQSAESGFFFHSV